MNIRPYQNVFPQIAASAYVDPAATVIGKVEIGEDSSIWPGASIRGDMHSIKIGNCTSIQDGCVLHITHDSTYNPEGFPLKIGNHITVGHKAVLHGATLHDFCLIGIGAILLDGSVVESDVILAAGSLVPPGKTLSSGYLWMGSPVVKKRLLTEAELQFIRYSAQNYVKLKNEYLDMK
jgi:carbonic anhydrase/acetyltransferase-like protein (isoleucine patch superfamily)